MIAFITRSTNQPSTVERLAHWFRRSAPLRASASLGHDHALEAAPNILPLRATSRIQAVANALGDFCRRRHYHAWVERDAIRVGLMRLREGNSQASAVQSAKARADFCAAYGKDPDAA